MKSNTFTFEDALQKLGLERPEYEAKHNRYTDKFSRAVEMLNPEQLQAVKTTEGPLMVIAGPGTGKTQILSTRIGKILLESDILPENILCLTYTDAGAQAMKKRLADFMGSQTSEIAVHTFHSFCSRIINENPQIFEREDDVEIISDYDRIQLLKEVLMETPFHTPLKKSVNTISSNISYLRNFFEDFKKQHYEVDTFLKWLDEDEALERQKEKYYYKNSRKGQYEKGDFNNNKWKEYPPKIEKLRLAARLYPIYEQKMKEHKFYEYEDLILNVLQQFKDNEDLRLHYQEKYQYILVDEFQDTNGVQMELVKWLTYEVEAPNIMIVGDDDQSIYSFQGANVVNIRNFYERFLSGYSPEEQRERIVVLKQNYRSTPAVIEAAKALISHNEQRIIHFIDAVMLDKNIQPASPERANDKTLITKNRYTDFNSEMIHIVEEIMRLKASGVPYSEMAVLFRTNPEIMLFTQYLNTQKIPYDASTPINILQQFWIQQLIDLLESIGVVAHGARYGEDVIQARIFDAWNPFSIQQNTKLFADFQEAKSQNAELRFLSFLSTYPEQKYRKFAANFEKLARLSLQEPVHTLFEIALDTFGIKQWIVQQENAVYRLQELNSLRECIHNLARSTQRLTIKNLIDTLAEYNAEGVSVPLLKSFHAPDAVQLMTLHKSKGLEFDYVFIPSLVERDNRGNNKVFIPESIVFRNVDIRPDETVNPEVEEARRLVFVGITRAKKKLYLSCYQYKTKNDGKTNELVENKFLKEIPENYLWTESPELTEDQYIQYETASYIDAQSFENQIYTDTLIEKRIENLKISASALNSYLECPRGFYYAQLLRFPQKQSKNIVLGNILHYALEKFFILAKTSGEIPDQKTLMELVMSELESKKYNYSPSEYEDSKAYLETVVPIFYAQDSEFWVADLDVEESIEAVYCGVPIKGKLDKIEWKNDHHAHIIDYKTGKYSNAKSRDKSLDPPVQNKEAINNAQKYGGKYWQQAVIYRLLFRSKYPNYTLDKVEFDFIFPDEDSKIHRHIVPISEEDEQFVGNLIAEVHTKIKNKEFEGCHEPDCTWCEMERVQNNEYEHRTLL